jgi:hypothetical protein
MTQTGMRSETRRLTPRVLLLHLLGGWHECANPWTLDGLSSWEQPLASADREPFCCKPSSKTIRQNDATPQRSSDPAGQMLPSLGKPLYAALARDGFRALAQPCGVTSSMSSIFIPGKRRSTSCRYSCGSIPRRRQLPISE